MAQIAKVTSISGTAQARTAEGALRELKEGSILREGETVVTLNGGSVELTMNDGTVVPVGAGEQMAMTRDLDPTLAADASESALDSETVEKVNAAQETGEQEVVVDVDDIDELVDTAGDATPTPSGLDGDGHSFVRLTRIDESVSEFHGIAGTPGPDAAIIVDEDLIPVDAIDDFATTELNTPVVINVVPNDDFQFGAIVTAVTDGTNGTVTINGDNTVTYTPNPGFFGTDVFTYTAVSADGNGEDTANVTVVIPGELPSISINNDVVIEGDIATLTITLSQPWDEPVSVQYRTNDDTAIAPGDYDPVTGLVTVTFEPGETEIEVNFNTNTDAFVEPVEQFLVDLSNPTNATISDPQGIVEIIDGTVLPTISINDDIVFEGNTATLTISLSQPWSETVTVQYRTEDDTAVAPGDYDPVTGLVTVTFEPGETEKEVQFSTNLDGIPEAIEQFLVNLSNPTNATIADPQGIVEIIDSTPTPTPTPTPPPGPGIEGGEALVYERGLEIGREPNPATRTNSSSFDFSVPAGVNSLTMQFGVIQVGPPPTLISGGDPIEIVNDAGQLTGATIEIGPVSIVFTGISQSGTTYTVEYTATLNGPIVNNQTTSGEPADVENGDIIGVLVQAVVEDDLGRTAQANYSVAIVDDVPDSILSDFGEALNNGTEFPGVVPAIVVDETDGIDNDGDLIDEDTGGTDNVPADRISSGDFSAFFKNDIDGSTGTADDDVVFGADGAGSVDYSLSLSVSGSGELPDDGSVGVASGLYAVEDGAPDGRGEQIMLYNNDGVIQGLINGGPGEGVLYFSITSNGAGIVTLEQAIGDGISIWHPVAGDNSSGEHDDVISLDGLGDQSTYEDGQIQFEINFTQTVFDVEGDNDSETVNLAAAINAGVETGTAYLLGFSDDGPIANPDSGFTVMGTVALDIDVLGNDDFGTDGFDRIEIVQDAAKGTLTINPDGTIRYDWDELVDGADSFTYRIYDQDGDWDEGTVNLNVDPDDAPAVSAENVLVDEDDLDEGRGDVAPGDEDQILTGTIEYNTGFDELKSISLSTDGNATDLQTLDGTAVVTTWNAVAGELIGYVATGVPTNPDDLVFKVTLADTPTSGTGISTVDYTVELFQPVMHSNPDTEDNETVTINVSVLDMQDDEGTTTFELSIDDDSPLSELNAQLSTAVQLAVDESAGKQPFPEDTVADRQSSDDFSVFFAAVSASSYGADGPGDVAYSLNVTNAETGVASGLYAVDGGQPNGQGQQIYLFNEGGQVVGRVGAGGSADPGGTVYFTIAATNAGLVSLTQAAGVTIWHPDTGDDDDVVSLDGNSAAYAIELSQTITDDDGDSSTSAVDLAADQGDGAYAFNFGDAGPDAEVNGNLSTLQQLAVDESAGQQANPEDTDGDRQSSDNFSAFFTAVNASSYGADGPGDVAYSLNVTNAGSGVASGLYALDGNEADGQGEEIFLFNEGGDIVGRVGSAGAADENGAVAFTISVTNSGTVTLNQSGAVNLWHPVAGGTALDHDDVVSLDGNNAAYEIELTQTITDADGDSDSATVDLAADQGEGDYAFNFGDAGPVAGNDNAGTIEGDVPVTIDVLANDNAGTDGLDRVELVGADGGATKGTVSVNPDGSLEYTWSGGSQGADTITYRIYDEDGDWDEATVSLSIDPNDSPIVSVSNDALVDEDDLPDGNADAADGDDDPVTTGDIEYNTFFDNLKSVSLSTTANATGLQTLLGVAVVTTWDAVAGELIGYIDGSDPMQEINQVFKVTLDSTPSGTTGAGTVGYTVTLLQPVMHTDPTTEDDKTFAVNVSVLDIDDDEATTSFNVTIDDDLLVMGDDFTKIEVANEVDAMGTGTGTFAPGADGWGSLAIVGPELDGVVYVHTTEDGGDTIVSTAYVQGEPQTDENRVFRFEVDLDGNTKFTLFRPEAGTEEFQTLEGTPAAGPDGSYPFGDITVTGSGLVNVSTQGIGNNNGNFDSGETLVFDLTGLGEPQDAVSFTFKGNQAIVDVWVSNNGTDWTLIGNDIEAVGGVLPTVESPDTFTWVRIDGETTASNTKVQGITLTQKILAQGQELEFTLNGTDGDGDTATTTVDVEVTVEEGDEAGAVTSTLSFDGSGADEGLVQEGEPAPAAPTAEADTLLGTDGADVFAWSLADNTAQGDTIVNFDEGSDVIDIADILEDSTDTADYASYLEVGLAGDGVSTVIKVSNSGDFDNAEQVITVEGVDLLGDIDMNDPAALNSALQQLVDAGKLVTE